MLILASASPRRADLLKQIGIPFKKQPVDIDETPLEREHYLDYVIRMSDQKAEAAISATLDSVSGAITSESQRESETSKIVVLAADTTVVIENRILGKPKDFFDFQSMMLALSGKEHHVITSVSMRSVESQKNILSDSTVSFADISMLEVEQYWQSGEPADKAGGYAIQGLGARFVKSITGSYTGIVGLPLYETAELLGEFGIQSFQSFS